jgi:hypothetical protein
MALPAAGQLIMVGLTVLGMAARGTTGPVSQKIDEELDFNKDDGVLTKIAENLGKNLIYFAFLQTKKDLTWPQRIIIKDKEVC